jgi:hypothetical protein
LRIAATSNRLQPPQNAAIDAVGNGELFVDGAVQEGGMFAVEDGVSP